MAEEAQNGAPKTNGESGHTPYDQPIVDVAHYVHHFHERSDRAWEGSAVSLLDSMGCAMESLALSPMCRSLLGPTVPGTIVPNGFKLPGTSYVLDPVTGAFNLGAMIRFLDHSDASIGYEWGHPSDNIGGILALLDYLSRAGPRSSRAPPATVGTLRAAMIKAYDIQSVYQHINSFNGVGIDQVILVKLASAGVCSWLLGHTEEQTCAVLSHVWMDGHPLRTYRQDPNAGARKGWAGGDASARGLQLAFLIGRGQEGAPTVLTDPKWGFYKHVFPKELKFNQPLNSKSIEIVFRKPMPAEAHALTAIEACANALKEATETPGFTDPAKDIKEIKVRIFKAAITIIDKTGPLRNFAARDHCMQYMLAVTILKNGEPLEASDYEDESPFASDPRIDALRDVTVLEEDPEFTKAYHYADDRLPCATVTFTLKDGKKVGGGLVTDCLGSPRRPDTLDYIRFKSRRNLERVFGKERVEKIFEAVEGEGANDKPVHEFVDLFEPEGKDFTKEK